MQLCYGRVMAKEETTTNIVITSTRNVTGNRIMMSVENEIIGWACSKVNSRIWHIYLHIEGQKAEFAGSTTKNDAIHWLMERARSRGGW